VDDAALVCSCWENMVSAARIFNEVAMDLGLMLSIPKTKLLVAWTTRILLGHESRHTVVCHAAQENGECAHNVSILT